MERRGFVKLGIVGLLVGAISVLTGCGRTESTPKRLGNQERLWRMTSASEKVNEPVDLTYAKNTPALYRDASFGKDDVNFKPKTGGG
jgi:hypothetical protein